MQNDMRDRLIELYKEATTLYFDYLDSIDEKGLTDTEGRAKFTIDHLIANGVIVLDMNVISPENRPLITHIANMPLNDVLELIEQKLKEMRVENDHK